MTGTYSCTAALAWLALIASTAGLCQTASGLDEAKAAYRKGRAYKLGDGVPADTREAERLLGLAASLGHAKAGGEYGLVLMHNDKPAEAIPWLRKAAERGDARAQYALGTLFFAGRGVKADPAEARRWIARAAKSGLPAAREALQIIDGTPPPAVPEIARAEPAVPAVVKPRAVQGKWRVQLGAFAEPENARRLWRKVGGTGGPTVSFDRAGPLTLLRAGPFESRAAASRYCATQRSQGRDCLVVE